MFFYALELTSHIHGDDLIDIDQGFNIVFDHRDLVHMKGVTIDWQVLSTGQAGFKFSRTDEGQQASREFLGSVKGLMST